MLYFKYDGYICIVVLIITLYFNIPSLVYSQSKSEGVIDIKHKIQDAIDTKIRFYNNKFKKILFVHLKGGASWTEELNSVLEQLGENAVALDYEHPKTLQNDLMYVTIERIKFMLENDGFSSTLFRVGENSTLKYKNMCVVTLNPETLSNNADALRYMLDYSDEQFKEIHPSRYLETIDFINFSIDHEAFHCLNSYLYGGSPITFETLGGEYNQLKRESAADAFALSMHIKKYRVHTNFSRNFLHFRSLSLVNDSLDHNTLRTVLKVMKIKNENLYKMNIEEIISLSKRIADETVGTYNDFKKQHALELKVLNKLGYENMLSKEQLEELERVAVDPLKVEQLLKQSLYFYQQLFSNTLINLKSYSID